MNATLHQDRPRLFAQQLQEKFDSRSGEYAGMMLEILGHSRRNRLKEELGFDMNDPVYIQVISYFEEIDRTSAVILRDMDELGYPDESIRKMKVVLTELLANAIYHGNKKDYTKKITIGHVTTKENTKVSVMDEGEGFDINRLPDPTLPENLEKDCGRGVFIVRNYADAIATNDKGNRITICKNR
jgi:serine/threonine-protein kinase RsbW